MATKRKYLYDNNGVGPKIFGTQLNFRTVTTYIEDENGNITKPGTFVYYTPKAGGRNASGEVWKPGTEDSFSDFKQGGYVLAATTDDKGKTYKSLNYTQADADAGRIPSGKNVGDPILSNEAIASLNKPGSAIYEAIQTSIVSTANSKQGLGPQVSARLSSSAGPNPDAAVPPSGSDPNSGGTSSLGLNDNALDPNNIPIFPSPKDDPAYDEATKKEKIQKGGSSFLKYPENMRDDQDRIVFERCSYVAKLAADPKEKFPHAGSTFSTIILPIQSGISDTNSVDWGGASLNPVEAFGVTAAMKLMDQGKKVSEVAIDVLDELQSSVTANKDMLKYYFAQEAVGVTGLLSRASGSVLNPNLSLLFNGPSLRPFSFTFRLSPRGPKESIIVKKIIRQFKEGSAVNTADTNVFLKAPDVFKIRYEGAAAKSLNQFKTCALTSVSVNYTPDGTYMTYGDGTMTSYELSLTFNELDPIYQVNYQDLGSDEIGY